MEIQQQLSKTSQIQNSNETPTVPATAPSPSFEQKVEFPDPPQFFNEQNILPPIPQEMTTTTLGGSPHTPRMSTLTQLLINSRQNLRKINATNKTPTTDKE